MARELHGLQARPRLGRWVKDLCLIVHTIVTRQVPLAAERVDEPAELGRAVPSSPRQHLGGTGRPARADIVQVKDVYGAAHEQPAGDVAPADDVEPAVDDGRAGVVSGLRKRDLRQMGPCPGYGVERGDIIDGRDDAPGNRLHIPQASSEVDGLAVDADRRAAALRAGGEWRHRRPLVPRRVVDPGVGDRAPGAVGVVRLGKAAQEVDLAIDGRGVRVIDWGWQPGCGRPGVRRDIVERHEVGIVPRARLSGARNAPQDGDRSRCDGDGRVLLAREVWYGRQVLPRAAGAARRARRDDAACLGGGGEGGAAAADDVRKSHCWRVVREIG